MTTKLINNYLNTYQTAPATNRSNTSYGSITGNNVEELDTRAYIKPLKGKGKLVKNNIFDIPGVMVKDAAYDIKAMKHAISGEANDHELGKINDIGMKLGGLAIAAYLFTRKQTPLTKAMEFVGLASFFASMAIWPKLAIQLPTKLISGINSQQKYIDSFGRKKPFDLDPQFLPWDAYGDDEIQKKGDRLGIPRNIPNRRDFIQEKIKKRGIQNNTLWMLTAGFATPIMSALICNKVEKPLNKQIDKYRQNQANKLMNNFPEAVEKAKSQKLNNAITRIIEMNKEQVINEQLFREILNTYADGMDLVTKKGLETDLRSMLFNNKYEVNKLTVEKVLMSIEKRLEQTKYKPLLEEILPKQIDLTKTLKNKNFLDASFDESGLDKISKEILLEIRRKIAGYNQAHPENPINWKIFILKLQNTTNQEDGPITKALKSSPASKMTADIQHKLKKLAGVMTDFNARRNVFSKYVYLKVGSAPETNLANYWNEVADDIVDIFKFTPKEIEQTRHDTALVNKLLREKMETIATDDEQFVQVMQKLAKRVAKINDIIPTPSPDLAMESSEKAKATFIGRLDSSIDNDIIPRLRDKELNMKHFIRRLIGTEYQNNNIEIRGSYKAVMKQFVNDRLLGVESSFLRIMNGLDRFYCIVKNENAKELTHGHSIEVKEELVEAMKTSILHDHSSDFATKGYMRRNPKPDPTRGNILIQAKRVVYQFFGKTPADRMVDIPSDAGFFQEKMKLIFDNPLSQTTDTILSNYGLKEKMNAWKRNSMSHLADQKYFAKIHHTIYGGATRASSMFKFLLTGIAPDEFMYNVFNQRYNTNKWFKMFGGMGAALLAVTVGAQFFFGKLKLPEATQKG